MTEFEQQVAEALARPMEGAYLPVYGIALMLAPRVAAAIAAAAELYADAIDGEWGAGEGPGSSYYEQARDKIHEAALAALRNKPYEARPPAA